MSITSNVVFADGGLDCPGKTDFGGFALPYSIKFLDCRDD